MYQDYYYSEDLKRLKTMKKEILDLFKGLEHFFSPQFGAGGGCFCFAKMKIHIMLFREVPPGKKIEKGFAIVNLF